MGLFQRFIRKIGRGWAGEKPLPLPQLVMRYPGAVAPDPGSLPEGYRLGAFQPGDEEGWVALLNANGELGRWNLERLRREIDGPLAEGGQQFVWRGKEIVAAAGVYARPGEEGDAWEIGWVAVHPAHRGKGLGRAATAAAVRAALRLPPGPIFLRTDDFRLAAIKVYLQLGFIPDGQHPSYLGRWQAVFGALGGAYVSYQALSPAHQPRRTEP